MGSRSTFRHGVEAGDLDVMMSAFAEDAVLYNPFYNQAFEGPELVRLVLGNVMEVFEDFNYVSELADERDTVGLIFRAKVGEYDIQGLDLVRFNADDEIAEFTVMVRPEKAATELHKQMVERMTRALDSK